MAADKTRVVADLNESDHPSFRLPTNKDIKTWRYLDFAKYLSMLDQRCLFFSRASNLGDPFEGSSPRFMVKAREYIRANKATDPALAEYKEVPDVALDWGRIPKQMVNSYLVNCWHMNEHESAAMWNLYSASNEAVCVQSTYRRLRVALPPQVLIGEVTYIDYETQGFPPSNAFNVFNFIMHKRLSFEHERELRAILWEMSGTPEAKSLLARVGPIGLAIPVDLTTLIENVYVSPTAAPWFAGLVEAMTKKCGLDFPVKQSVLGEQPLY
jgi:hypothetical protein